jgi:hypothetical protein
LKKNVLETQKQTEFYKTQLKKHIKTASQKLRFKLNFFYGPHSIKHNLVHYQTPNCVFYTVNTKITTKQTQPK